MDSKAFSFGGEKMDERSKDSLIDTVEKLSLKYIGWLAILCFIATVLIASKTQYYDQILRSSGRSGIIDLELAFSPQKVEKILLQWRSCEKYESENGSVLQVCKGFDCAERLQRWDWFFILAYTSTLVVTIAALSRMVGMRPKRRARFMFTLPLIIALCDVLENLLIAAFLADTGRIGLWSVTFMSLLAACKFLLLCLVLLVMAYAFGFWLMAQRARAEESQNDPKILKKFSEIYADERRYLRFRRRKAEVADEQPCVGLASSGGGIRSATVNLGVIERFLDRDLLRRIDYHSTVSGGGYIGSALSSLLSFKLKNHLDIDEGVSNTEFAEGQYSFSEGDVAHFDCAEPSKRPFPLDTPGFPDDAPAWLSRRMVLAHIRSFGDYLVRRRRLLSRDVLRVLGTLAQGMAGTFGIFIVSLMACVSLCFTLLAFVDHGQTADFLWFGADGKSFGRFFTGALNNWFLVFSLGMVYAGILLKSAKMVQKILPEKLFHRDGDTHEECLQFRLLWIMGIILGIGAFTIPALLSRQVGVFAPALFLAGATIVSAFSFLILCLTIDAFRLWNVSDSSSSATRSLYSAIFGLFLCMTVFAGSVAFLPWLVSLLMLGSGNLQLSPESLWSTGGAGFFSLLAAGLIAWWKRALAVGEKNKQILEMMNKGKKVQGFFKRLLLALPIFILLAILLLVCGACAVRLAVLVEKVLSISISGGIPGYFSYGILTIIFSAIVLFFGYVVDFNKLSMHYFYRDRLAEAYLSTTGPIVDGGDILELKRDNTEMKLSDLHGSWQGPKMKVQDPNAIAQRLYGPSKQSEKTAEMLNALLDFSILTPDLLRDLPLPNKLKSLLHLEMETETEYLENAATSAPYHLYCACLNLTTDRNMQLRTRKSDIFLFSKLYCGSKTTGFLPTRMYRKDETKVARAMTVSGAAIDSFLGRSTFFAQSFAMTLFNIRLGQWMENPGYRHGTQTHKQESGIFWPAYLFMEACGMSDSRRRLVHLSDGGHTGDNLGIVPLFERGCGLIIAVDAEADPEYRFGSLLTALRYLEDDDNIRVKIDLEPLRPDAKTGLSQAPFVLGDVEYHDYLKNLVAKGCLLLLKSAVTADMSLGVRKHKEQYPEFPQESTGDQFFSEDQFDAYRALGKEIATAVFKALPSLVTGIDCRRLREEYSLWLQNNL